MKTYAILVLGLLVAASAFASPNVGDAVELVGTIQGTPVTLVFALTNYNSSTNQYQKHTTLTPTGGQARESDKWVDGSTLVTDAQLEYIVANCSEQGGVLESVQVASGSFDTCKVPQKSGGSAWIGKVPFGIVKLDANENGSQWQVQLNRFSRGQ